MRPRGWQLSLLLFKHSARFVELRVCQNSPGFCFSCSVGRSRDVLMAELGQQHIEEALHCSWQLSPWPCQRLHYPVEGVESLASCGQKLCILVSVSNASVYQSTQLSTGNSYVMVPCWTKANAGDEYSSWHRSDVLTPLQAAVTRISPLQVSD